MFSKATLVKYLHICWPLAVDITHNRERKAPNALIHWTSARLLLQRRKKARCCVSAQQVLPYHSPLFLPCSLFHLVFPSIIQSFSPLRNRSSSASLRFSFTLSSSGAATPSLQTQTISFIWFLGLSFFLLQFIQDALFSILCSPSSPHSLCSCAHSSDTHLSVSLWLPSLNPFPCHSPSQGHPPVSSIAGHEEKLARRSDNLLTPHLSSERGKAPS